MDQRSRRTPESKPGLQDSLKRARRSVFLVAALMLLLPYLANATHFRFGLITATRLSETITTATYRLNVSLSWRLGTAPAAIPFTISGGNSGTISVPMTSVTDPSGTYDNSSGTLTVTLNKSTTLTRVEFTGFNKLTTISNNANTNWDVYTLINTGAPGSSPVSTMPAIINMPAGVAAATYNMTASDPDAGSTLTFGTPPFTGALAAESEPPGFAVNSATGQIVFNTIGKIPGQQYNALVSVTDNDGNMVLLDFLINMVSTSAPPQFDYAVTPTNGSVYNILVGQNITFPIQATNPGSGTTVGLSVSGLPSYITTANFSPAFPATGNPSMTNFSWTPSALQLGNKVILNFIATNNLGIQTSSAVTINVVAEPAPLYMSSTPVEGSIRSIVAGTAHTDTITAQSSIGSNVSIAYAFVPSGATTSPSVPTTGSNPGQLVFSWTPPSSDFGVHHLTFESIISSSPTIFSTLHYDLIVDDLPVFASTPATTATGCVAYTYSVVATDANIPYGDTVEIAAHSPLPSWLTLTPTGNGTAILSGTPTNADAGTYIIDLAAEDLYHHNYSVVAQSFTITVNANSITGTPAVCVGATTTLGAAAGTGGTWSSSNTNAAIDPATGVLTGMSAGASLISYTLGGGCTITATATVNALPSVAAITGTAHVCIGAVETLMNTTAGGVWSSSDLSIATIGSSSGIYTGTASGTSIISYTVTDVAGCVNSIAAGITVDPTFAIVATAGANGTISAPGSSNICLGDAMSYTITADAGYHIDDVLVDGSSVGTGGFYMFSSVNATHTISATFASNCTAPTITCSADVLVNADPGACNTIVTYAAATATGTSPVITYSQNSGTSFPVGTTLVVATATNACGIHTCSMNVTVEDWELPTISAPADITMNADPGACSVASIALGTPVAGDNCGVASVVNNAMPPYGIGTTVVTWTVTDASGNTAFATQHISIIDNQYPVITVPSDVTVNADAGLCTASGVVLGTPSTSDNCGVLSVTNDAPAVFSAGTTVVTWTVTDVHGNVTTGTQNVHVVDNQLPVITAPASITVNADAGTCTASGVALGTPVTGDNCGVASVTNDALPPYATGTTVVTWTVTDIHGNTATAVQNVTVIDNQNPVITAPADVTVNADAGSCSAASVSLGTPSTSDNCGVASVINSAVAPYVVGTTVVTWTVRDVNGNLATATQNVIVVDNQPPVIAAPQDITMEGYCSPVSVTLSTPFTSDNCGVASVTNDAPAMFPVGTTIVTWTVTDIHGNTATATQTVVVSGSIGLTATTVNVNCNGASTGSITTAVTGGTAPFSYRWSTGATTANLTGIPAGTYSVTVTDGHDCNAGGVYTITQPAALSLGAVAVNVKCYGANNGTITTNVTGGTTAYSYSWSTGSTSANLTALTPGTYSVTVTDANGCMLMGAYTITQPSSALALSAIKTNAGCYGSTGSITTTVTGGSAPYTYLWSNGATTSSITPVAGSYSVAVTDASGCSVTGGAYIVTQPANAFVVTSSIGNVSCYGGSNGNIDITVTGGTLPYSYSWITGGRGTVTGGDLFSVPVGTYSVTVTDVNGCSVAASFSITEPTAVNVTAITTNVTCYGGSNGKINTTVTGGTPTYSYTWSNGSTLADPVGLSAGTYSVTVRDSKACSQVLPFTVTQPSPVTGTIAVSPVYPVTGGAAYTIYLIYGLQTETLSATASGGTPGYTYSWAPAFGSTSTLSASPTTTTVYSVTITDALGCTGRVTQTIQVLEIRCNGAGRGRDHETPRKCIYVCEDGHSVLLDSIDVAAHLAAGAVLGRCNGHGSAKETAEAETGNTIEDVVSADAIKVYPNPTSGMFSVAIPVINKTADILVTDITGRVIEVRTVAENIGEPIQFSLANLPDGIYLVKVKAGENIHVAKLLKK